MKCVHLEVNFNWKMGTNFQYLQSTCIHIIDDFQLFEPSVETNLGLQAHRNTNLLCT